MKTLAWTAVLFAAVALARGASVDEDWQAVIALDAGPQSEARSPTEAQAAITAHLVAQEKALRAFLDAHAVDAHAFEARLRLSRLLSIRGRMLGDGKAREEAVRVLDALSKSATPDQQKEIDFARISQAMRRTDTPSPADRQALLDRARKFQSAYPDDRRLAELLTEVATLFDLQPRVKRKLLADAQTLARDEQLQARIGDDLKKLDSLNQKIALAAPAADGGTINIEDYRGRPVVLCFFAMWSVPSLESLDAIKRAAATFPKGRVQVVGMSLDTKPNALADFLKRKAIAWPVVCDGKAWESPLLRSLGINALPTVWLLDREGRLRSLDALENTSSQVRQLLDEH